MQHPHCNDRPNPLGCGPWYMKVPAELSRWDKSAPLVDPRRPFDYSRLVQLRRTRAARTLTSDDARF